MDLKPLTDIQFHPTTCSECKSTNTDGAQYCSNCGKPYPHLLYIAYLENELGPTAGWTTLFTGGGVPGGVFSQDELDAAVAAAVANAQKDMVPAADYVKTYSDYADLKALIAQMVPVAELTAANVALATLQAQTSDMVPLSELEDAQAELARLMAKMAQMMDQQAVFRAVAQARQIVLDEEKEAQEEVVDLLLAVLSLLETEKPQVSLTAASTKQVPNFAWLTKSSS